MNVAEAKSILQKKYPSYNILNVRKFNNRYVFEMLPPEQAFDWDAYYAVDKEGKISFFSPVFAKDPSEFLKLKPILIYKVLSSDSK